MTGFVQEKGEVIENVCLARQTFRLRLALPGIGSRISPGQFLMLRAATGSDPLLGRPFALYDTDGHTLDVVYLVVGKMTAYMAGLKQGDRLDAWGPLGNGFPELTGSDHVGLVAGGIGQTPFLAHARALLGGHGYGGRAASRQAKQVSLYYGVRSAEYLAGLSDFEKAGATVHLSTDDGSAGFRGLVTELLSQHQAPDVLVGCGPEPMLHALRRLALARGSRCYLSLETPMACGIGICFSCVTRIETPDGWDYRRVCTDGPVFDASTLWHAS